MRNMQSVECKMRHGEFLWHAACGTRWTLPPSRYFAMPGYGTMEVNGNRVDGKAGTRTWSQYDKRTIYGCYDILDDLVSGSVTIALNFWSETVVTACPMSFWKWLGTDRRLFSATWQTAGLTPSGFMQALAGTACGAMVGTSSSHLHPLPGYLLCGSCLCTVWHMYCMRCAP
jgi:hypothetical protein